MFVLIGLDQGQCRAPVARSQVSDGLREFGQLCVHRRAQLMRLATFRAGAAGVQRRQQRRDIFEAGLVRRQVLVTAGEKVATLAGFRFLHFDQQMLPR